MDYNPEHLIVKYLTNELSEEERVELDRYLSDEKNKKFFEELIDKKFLRREIEEQVRIAKGSEAAKAKARQLATVGAPVFMMGRKSGVIKYLVAASVVAVMGVVAWVYLNPGKKSAAPVIAKSQVERFKNDVAPANQSTILLTADGRKINIDSVDNGNLSLNKNYQILKKDGEVIYSFARAKPSGEIGYSIMTTGKGDQQHLILSDGSQVWLNAQSSIRFPEVFVGNQRIVEVTGEAYFDISSMKLSKGGKMPFIVKTSGGSIRVTGTQFNVQVYSGEPEKTTLIEGSVLVNNTDKVLRLSPGQQSETTTDGQIKIVENANVEEAISWRNGVFMFKDASIETIMKQVARWYDIDVLY